MEKLVGIITNTPFYPHWLDFRNTRKGNEELIPYFYGKVLETGCGNGEKKHYIMNKNKKVKKYIATDYSSWDEEFQKQAKLMNAFGRFTQILYGTAKSDKSIDAVCDALKLPYKENTFDVYCSFEVLEHINNVDKYFKEANKVLKKNGLCILTMPYLFRDHGGIEMDFSRLSRGGFHYYANKNGFEVIHLNSYCCFGTTIAILINQYLIRKIMENKLIYKIPIFFISPFIFFITNTLGLVIDSVDKDIRFASRHHVVMKKIK